MDRAESDFSIHIHAISTVVPESPTRRCTLPLTGLDFLNRNGTCMQRVLFYSLDLEGVEEYSSLVSKLKSSLSKTLVSFFPLAGRFTDGEVKKPRINCNAAGIPFIEGSMRCKTLHEFLESSLCMELCSELVHAENYELADAPHVAPLSVQVTIFKSGGFAIGVAYNHFLIDGYSFWHFMNSWAETARDGALSMPPVHSREIWSRPSSKSSSSNSLARYFAVPATPSMEIPIGFCGVRQRMYSFSAHFIRKLKLEALANTDGQSLQLSSFKVLCAHIWRAIIRARGLEASAETRFFVGVDVRKRLLPSLPDGYFGNAVCAVFAESTAGDLVDSSTGIAHGVRVLSDAISDATDNNIRSLLSWCERQGNVYFRGADYARDNNFVVVSSPKFPAYKINYGWGQPVAVRPGKLPWAGVLTFFTGPKGCGDVDVSICLFPDELQRLEQDHSFLDYCPGCATSTTSSSKLCSLHGVAIKPDSMKLSYLGIKQNDLMQQAEC